MRRPPLYTHYDRGLRMTRREAGLPEMLCAQLITIPSRAISRRSHL